MAILPNGWLISYGKFFKIKPDQEDVFVVSASRYMLNVFEIDEEYLVEAKVGFGVRNPDGEWLGPFQTENEAQKMIATFTK